MLSLNPRSRMSATVILASTDLQAKLQLDEIATSFGQRQPSEPREKDLIETIKVPLGNNLRRLGNVLPKPCYPDVRPNSPSSWTVAEQEKQQRQQVVPISVASTYIPSKPVAAADTSRSDMSSIAAVPYVPKPAPRMPLASIPEANNNFSNPPSRGMYSNAASQAPQAPPKVSYSAPSRPTQIRRYPPPQQPSAVPIMSQVSNFIFSLCHVILKISLIHSRCCRCFRL